MIRATTPTHIFKLPFDTSLIKEVLISYVQHKVELVDKSLDDCILDGDSIITKLSQKDTIKFSERRPLEIQIRVITINDTALATNIIEVDVGRVLNDNILGRNVIAKSAITNYGETNSDLYCNCCVFDVEFGELYEVGISQEEIYVGHYEFIPAVGVNQVIPTANKYIANDIVVEAIPYHEVSNGSDGITVTIG